MIKRSKALSILSIDLDKKLLALEEAIKTLPEGRSRSLAQTKLDECSLWIEQAVNETQQ